MATPWLQVQDSMRSIAGMAELNGIGRTLAAMTGFDEKTGAALRLNLGDWRDQIAWRPEVLNEPRQRAECLAYCEKLQALLNSVPKDQIEARIQARFVQALLNHNDFISIR